MANDICHRVIGIVIYLERAVIPDIMYPTVVVLTVSVIFVSLAKKSNKLILVLY